MKELFYTTLSVVTAVALLYIGQTFGTSNIWITGAAILGMRFIIAAYNGITLLGNCEKLKKNKPPVEEVTAVVVDNAAEEVKK